MGRELQDEWDLGWSRERVWVFGIIPGSWDKLRSYWTGPYKIVRKIAPALVEVLKVYKQGKPRLVSIIVLKNSEEIMVFMDFLVIHHTLKYWKPTDVVSTGTGNLS